MYKNMFSWIKLYHRQNTVFLVFSALCLFATTREVLTFHSGAPVEACDSLLPRHLHTFPSPPSESPYIFTASASRFFPDSKRRKIKVKIRGAPFKGFFIVALDAETNKRIGSFLDARGMQPVPCSAVTHSDGHPKVMAKLLWIPPENRKSGEVLFRATILQSFSVYYSDLIASVPTKTKKSKEFRNTTCTPDSSCLSSTAIPLELQSNSTANKN